MFLQKTAVSSWCGVRGFVTQGKGSEGSCHDATIPRGQLAATWTAMA